MIAIGNLLGLLLLGRLFDVLGRKIMISGTYLLSGALLLLTAERKSLEDIARPLTATDPGGSPARRDQTPVVT